MTANEVAFLKEHMLKAESYLEFGSGRSTSLAASIKSIRHIASVESDPQFVRDHVLSHPEIQHAVTANRLSFCYVRIGPTGMWGHPRDKTEFHMWPNYPLGQLQARSWNLILVDGRFRVACCLAAGLESPRDIPILLHDFYRPEYHYVLNFMERVAQVDTLIQLRLRPNVSRRAVQAAIKKYQYIPGDCTKARVAWRKLKKLLGVPAYPDAPKPPASHLQSPEPTRLKADDEMS
jgi:protein O-GlcNAc transferase